MKGRRDVNASPEGGRRGHCVFGVHAVRAHLEQRPGAVVLVWVAPGHDRRRRQICELAAAAGVEVSLASAEELAGRAGSNDHQGVVALLREFPYASIEKIISGAPGLLVAADGIEDPRNLGAVIRGVAAAGAGGLIIPRDRSAAVTAAVEKTAAGITAWFPVVRVTNLSRALHEVKEKGQYWVIGLDQKASADLFEAEVPLPAVLVVGGETGLREGIGKACDLAVRIPMDARVESLNVAVAAAVAAFEIRRRLLSGRGH